ncbi:hypothetical protein FPOA_06799 [Fusarium poae]|uniref:CBM-cenC domain-containing protein n=1 Tax=Fusarium poae TaxID=36050 RepID=A0A1B8AIM8_FUSPO|nr:hypothetical protein FPOA_06799 [Fusarium poae]
MTRRRTVALLAATIISAIVNASPCKPHSSVVLLSTITYESTATASSAITIDEFQTTVTETSNVVSDTTEGLETSVTDTVAVTSGVFFETSITQTSTARGTADAFGTTTTTEIATDTAGNLETTPTDITTVGTTEGVGTTTTEAVIETSPTSIESTTTTVDEPACIPSQILVNTGFDDNKDGSPWTFGTLSTIKNISPHSAPNVLYNAIALSSSSLTTVSVSQDLPALGTSTYALQYYFDLYTSYGSSESTPFVCKIAPKLDQQALAPSEILLRTGPYKNWRVSNQYFIPQDPDSPVKLSLTVECVGSGIIVINIDDVTLPRVCEIAD